MRIRTLTVVAASLALLASCSPRAAEKSAPTKAEAPAIAAAEPAPQAIPAPMSAERAALCVAALDAFAELGKAGGPAGLEASEAQARATLFTMRRMELEMADRGGFTELAGKAATEWKDKTPADIEAAAAQCYSEIKR